MIKVFPDSILRQKAIRVKSEDKVGFVLEEMFEAMHEAKGLGLAANQIGLHHNIFILNDFHLPVFINPEIINISDEYSEEEEYCLSLPNQKYLVRRPSEVLIRAEDRNRKSFRIQANGYLARVILHEYDHLQGKLIRDYERR
jgi:peptide deformylase